MDIGRGRAKSGNMQPVPAYYINLPFRSDRRTFMEDQFERLGLQAKRIAARQPAELEPDFLARHADPRRALFLSPPQLSCTASHIEVWRTMLADGVARALIVEDDALLAPALPAFLRELPELPFDLIRIETCRRPLLCSDPIPGVEIAGVRLRRFRSTGWGSAGYVITADAARRLLERTDLFDRPTDVTLFCPIERPGSTLRLAQTDPALCTQLRAEVSPRAGAAKGNIGIFLQPASLTARLSVLGRHLRWGSIKLVDMVIRRDLRRRLIGIEQPDRGEA